MPPFVVCSRIMPCFLSKSIFNNILCCKMIKNYFCFYYCLQGRPTSWFELNPQHCSHCWQVMVTNVTSLLKTVKAVEDEATRGTRALEATIEFIKQELTVSVPDRPSFFFLVCWELNDEAQPLNKVGSWRGQGYLCLLFWTTQGSFLFFFFSLLLFSSIPPGFLAALTGFPQALIRVQVEDMAEVRNELVFV